MEPAAQGRERHDSQRPSGTDRVRPRAAVAGLSVRPPGPHGAPRVCEVPWTSHVLPPVFAGDASSSHGRHTPPLLVTICVPAAARVAVTGPSACDEGHVTPGPSQKMCVDPVAM